jgi:hypothetical protein
VEGKGLPPGVQDGELPDLGTEMSWIGGKRQEHLGQRAHDDGVNERLVLEGDLSGFRRQCEDTTWTLGTGRNSLYRAANQAFRVPLALRTMAVAAGVIAMQVRPQASHASTRPPNAAARWTSIALMTCRSTRPRCPA